MTAKKRAEETPRVKKPALGGAKPLNTILRGTYSLEVCRPLLRGRVLTRAPTQGPKPMDQIGTNKEHFEDLQFSNQSVAPVSAVKYQLLWTREQGTEWVAYVDPESGATLLNFGDTWKSWGPHEENVRGFRVHAEGMEGTEPFPHTWTWLLEPIEEDLVVARAELEVHGIPQDLMLMGTVYLADLRFPELGLIPVPLAPTPSSPPEG